VIFAPSHFNEFQMANRGMLLSRIVKNIVLAVSIIAVPTIILLGIIAGKFVAVQDGAVIVDVSLGVLLVFTSLAAVTAPFVYGTFDPRGGG
jgi:predicted membrane chloride channel (bestrophin family)